MTTERSTFELRLAEMFDGYADRAPIEVDAVTLATSIARARPRGVLDRSPAMRRWLAPMLLALLLLAAMALAIYVGTQLLLPKPVGYDEHFVAAGEMTVERVNPVVVALADGRVLIASGIDGSDTPEMPSAEVFDPESGQSVSVTGAKPYGGDGSGVLLEDGRVLIIQFSMNTTSSRAYIFDDESAEFRELDQPGYSNAPPFGVQPSMAVLNDGRVLIAGGKRDVYEMSIRQEAMVFDAETEAFVPTGSMLEPRIGHSMTTLRDGRVLVVGGGVSLDAMPSLQSSTAEIFDPETGTFEPTGGLTSFSGFNLGVLLADGRVAVMPLITADEMGNPEPDTPTQVEIYDPSRGTFSVAGSTEQHPDVVLPLRDGRILLVGSDLVPSNPTGSGIYYDLYQPWALIFDPATGEAEQLPPPRTESAGAALLHDGRVLFAGGLAYPPPSKAGNGTGDAFAVPWVDIFD